MLPGRHTRPWPDALRPHITTEREVDPSGRHGPDGRHSAGFRRFPMTDAAPPSGVTTGALHVNGVPRSFPFWHGQASEAVSRGAAISRATSSATSIVIDRP
jgi:hypothetical protein